MNILMNFVLISTENFKTRIALEEKNCFNNLFEYYTYTRLLFVFSGMIRVFKFLIVLIRENKFTVYTRVYYVHDVFIYYYYYY